MRVTPTSIVCGPDAPGRFSCRSRWPGSQVRNSQRMTIRPGTRSHDAPRVAASWDRMDRVGGLLQQGNPGRGRPSPVGHARVPLGDDSDLARSALRSLADRPATAASEDSAGLRARHARWPGMARRRPVPHDERRAARHSRAALDLRVSGVERADVRPCRGSAGRVLFQPGCRQPGRGPGRENAAQPAVLFGRHDGRPARERNRVSQPARGCPDSDVGARWRRSPQPTGRTAHPFSQ